MSESDIFERMFDAIQVVLTIFSIFFTLVSGYLAALYLFLHQAPFVLRGAAFVLLSVGFLFLGGNALVIGRMQEGLFVAWDRLGRKIVSLDDLRNPLPVDARTLVGMSQQELGVAVGWIVAFAVYLALFYLTFLYRWPNGPRS